LVSVTQLQEAGDLVGAIGVDGTTQVGRVIGDEPHGASLHPYQRGDHTRAETTAQFQDRAGVGDRVDRTADVVDPQPVLRNDVPEQSLIGHVPVLDRTLEVGQVLFGCTYRGRVVLDQQVDDPVGFLHLDGTDLFRPV